MLSLDRSDRIFNTFLDLQSKRIDNVEGMTSTNRTVKLRKLIINYHARRLASDDFYERYERDKEYGFDGTFLEWLIDHADEIIALILKIIALFGL